MATFDLAPLFRQWIGFDELQTDLERTERYPAFPPYDIEKIDDNHYHITIALAGFKRNELDIEQQGSHLTINGTHSAKENDRHYIHHGVSKKSFQLRFTIAEYLRVEEAEFSDGLLAIRLFREVPKELLPLKIAIKQPQKAALEGVTLTKKG